MKIPAIRERQWKIVLCAALVLFGAIWAVAIANWQAVVTPGVSGDLRISSGSAFGYEARVKSIQPDSPLAAFGVKAGDTLAFDHLEDATRQVFAAGEPVGLSIGAAGARRHVTVRCLPLAHIETATAVVYPLVLVNSLVALVLAALIGLRRAGSPSARMLALVLLMETFFCVQFMPGGALMRFSVLVLHPLLFTITYCGFFLFSSRFPNDDTAHVPPWVRWAGRAMMLCVVVGSLAGAADDAGWYRMPPQVAFAQPVLILAAVALSMVNLWHAYQGASGAARQRVLWVGLALGVRFLNYIVSTVPGLAFVHAELYVEGAFVVTTIANIGLAYGILRHRVLDVGFAVNRALVYAIVSAVMLVSFGLLEWLAHHFISGEEGENNILLDGAIALGLYLGFHRLKHSIDHVVEKLFFHRWHANEEALRRFVRQAAHITDPANLAQACLIALQRFSGDAGCALYRREEAGGYLCASASGMQAPSRVAVNDPLAVALRAGMAPALPSDAGSALPAALALPMGFRGELQGFVLLGAKLSQGSYRPDEVAVLEYAVQQVGLDWQALQTEQLKLRVAGLEQELVAYARAFELQKAAAQPS